MFELRITVSCIEEAERILESLKHDAAAVPAAGLVGQISRSDRGPRPQPVEGSAWLRKPKAALMGVQAKYGAANMAKPLAILGQFGIERVNDLKRADCKAFIAACLAA